MCPGAGTIAGGAGDGPATVSKGAAMRLTRALVVSAVFSLIATPAVAKPPSGELHFLGQAIVPTGTVYRATTVGGLSSITYDARRGVYYTLSDDPNAARFYTVGVDLRDGRLSNGDVSFRDVTTLLAPGGQPYPSTALDPEGLALTKHRELILTSEGFAQNLVGPFIHRQSLDGRFLGDLGVPSAFLTTADQ